MRLFLALSLLVFSIFTTIATAQDALPDGDAQPVKTPPSTAKPLVETDPTLADAEVDTKAASTSDEAAAEDAAEEQEAARQARASGRSNNLVGEAAADNRIQADGLSLGQEAANYAGTSGELKYDIDFDIPQFRNISPNLGLSYNSLDIGRMGGESWVGTGWMLKGFSTIERVSKRRGAPTYSDANDIYVLDGLELMKCASAPASIVYPASHVTDNSSPSCKYGGNFTAKQDGYFRIFFDQGRNEFVITQKDGTIFKYQSVDALTSVPSGADPVSLERIRKKRKWLLTEVRDTQATANKVNYTYSFTATGKSTYWQGYSHRPATITYAGYTIEFKYIQQARPVGNFSTGTQYLGRQWHLLEAITVKYGSDKVRAWDLAYKTASVTQAKLLRAVKQIGRNFSYASNGSVSGTALPAHRFEYNDDGYKVKSRFYDQFANFVPPTNMHDGVHGSNGDHGASGGETFHTSIRTVETNGDGIDEILALDLKPNGTGNPFYRERPGHYTFDKDGNMSRTNNAYAIPTGRFTDGGSYWTYLGMSRWTPNSTRPMAIMGRFYNTGDRRFLFSKPLMHGWYNELQVDGAHERDRVHWLVGNFDADPDMEIMIRDVIHDFRPQAGSGAERFPRKPLQRVTHPECTGRTWVNGRVADLNGDGIDDVLFKAKYNGKADRYCRRMVTETGYVDQLHDSQRVITCCANVENRLYWAFAFGDFNGDGVNDSVRFGSETAAQGLELWVSAGHGDGKFAGRTKWSGRIDMWNGALGNGHFYANAVIPTDVNGDGLDDVIVFAGYDDGTYSWKSRKWSGPIRVFLSTGTEFVEQLLFPGGAQIGNFATLGDYNGDGVIDLAYGEGDTGNRPRILFGTSKAGHKITKITTPMGETLDIGYKPSTHFAGDQTPFVRQLVHTITSNPGIGGARTVTFKYENGRYDYTERQFLGFQKIIVTLPKVPGESTAPERVTEYLTGHLAEVGLATREYMRVGSTIWQDKKTWWSVTKTGKGPWKATKTREDTGSRTGNGIVYKRMDWGWNEFNEKLWERNYGFSGAEDDVTMGYRYVPNTTAYIVNKVAIKSTNKGTTTTTGNSPDRIYAEFFGFDGGGWGDQPTRGNPTRDMVWSGNPTRQVGRTMITRTFDAHGNMVSEMNARNHTSNFVFTGPARMFQRDETNAEGHRTRTDWHYVCQKPSKVTDLNGVTTNYYYDTHCRETSQVLRWSGGDAGFSEKKTTYNYIGNGTKQYVEVKETSSNQVAGQEFATKRQYFDGYGQIYKQVNPGKDSNVVNGPTIVRSFDARGRVLWESNPISWNDAVDNVANGNQRTTYLYDVLGRPTRMTFADGARQQLSYGREKRTIAGLNTYYPYQHVMGTECYDAGSANTVCDETRIYQDADDNQVLINTYDRASTDTNNNGNVERGTTYTYDLLKRLVQVNDPGGIEYTYEYDVYGFRKTLNDPGLGRWRYTFYEDGSIKSRVDAKNQEIYYWRDKIGRETRRRVQLRNDNGDLLSTKNVYTYWDGDNTATRSGHYYKGQVSKQVYDTHTVENHYEKRGLLIRQTNTVEGKTYTYQARYTKTGKLLRQTYFFRPGNTNATWTPDVIYDSADRQIRFGSYITNTTYNVWDKIATRDYGNGASSLYQYDGKRGWVTRIYHRDKNGSNMAFMQYTKSVAGRVMRVNTHLHEGDLDYRYDYTGRLLSATYWGTVNGIAEKANQTFTYDRSGRMRFNSRVGTYEYRSERRVGSSGKSIYAHSPKSILRISDGKRRHFWHDANGNMTRGLHYKLMEYDGENRITKVTHNGNVTHYLYGASGERLMRVERVNGTSPIKLVYLNGSQIENFGAGASGEKVESYLAEEVRLRYDSGAPERQDYLHMDQLGSVIAVSKPDGTRGMRRAYRPFGEISYQQQWDVASGDEDMAFLGEEYDADAGLVYLNARYYDAELGLFMTPDWLDPTEQGVGTNRFSYAFNDPINKMDPEGNLAFIPILAAMYTTAQLINTIYTIATLPATIATFVNAVQAGEAAGIIGSMVLEYAVNEVINRAIPYARWIVPNSVRRRLTNFLGSRINLDELGQSVIDATCGINSFDGSTQVVTKDGRARIDSLLLGVEVLSRDEVSGEVDWKTVTNQHMTEYEDRWDIKVLNPETGQTQVLKSSWSHPFFVQVPENTPMVISAEGHAYRGDLPWGAWMEARDLEPGYILLQEDGGWAEIVAVTPVDEPLTAYNVTVDDFETFYVAANDNAEPVWVHNCSRRLGNNVSASNLSNNRRLPGYQCHHICADTHRLHDGLRDRFDNWGIGVDDAANGIFLPGGVNTLNVDGSTVHPRTHAYYRWVTDQFRGVGPTDSAGAREVLGRIRSQLGRGEYPWLNN